MKKLVLLAITGIFLVSCGGWSNDDKEFAMWVCEENFRNMDDDACECYVEKLEEKFGSLEEFMDAEHELLKKLIRAQYEEDDDLEDDIEDEMEDLKEWRNDEKRDCYDD